jgi:hypothetical protein
VILMRRLAILFTILVATSAVEHIALTGTFGRIMQAPRRIRRALISLTEWRTLLIGPVRLFQRTTSRGAGPWLGQSN